MSIIIALLVFTVIVVVHEFGHFIVARKCGILVEEFAIGMGPKLISFKPGETIYSIRILPLGGFCKMLGEDIDCKDEKAFNTKKVWQRSAVILAGAGMNFVLAFFVMIFITSFSVIKTTKIGLVTENSPAQRAGIEVGDKIIQVDGHKISIFPDLPFYIDGSGGKEITILLKKSNGEIIEKKITPEKVKQDEYESYIIGFQGTQKLGVFAKSVDGVERATLSETLYNSYKTMLFYVKLVMQGVVKLVTLNFTTKDVAGPIGLVSAIGTTYDKSIVEGAFVALINILSFMVLLSVNLGVFNLLPLPALDGGRFVFLVIEGIRGKPVPPEKEGVVHLVGFALLMVLAVFVAYNDIVNLLQVKELGNVK